jgi:hypothetical protein
VPVVLGVAEQEVDFAPGDDVRNLTRSELGAFVRTKVEPFYGPDFTSALLTLYGLPADASTGIDEGGGGVKGADAKGSDGVLFEPQRKYAEIIADAATFCPTLPLARAIAASRALVAGTAAPHADEKSTLAASAAPPLYVYSTAQAPSQEGGYCPLSAFNAFGYCPRFAFHAIDMFLLFQAEYPSYLIEPGSVDAAYSDLVLSAFRELATTGAVAAWPEFHYSERNTSAGALPSAAVNMSYDIVDLQTSPRLPSGSLPNFKEEKCQLFLAHGFYEDKAWIN